MPHLVSKIFAGINVRGDGTVFVVSDHNGIPTCCVNTLTNTILSKGTLITDGFVHTGVTPMLLFDSLIIRNVADPTKRMCFDLSAISTGTKRTIIMPDADVDLGTLVSSILTTEGDILYRNATDTVRFPIGTAENFLKSNGTALIYTTDIARVNENLTQATIVTEYTVLSTTTKFLELVTSAGSDDVKLPDATTLPLGWEIIIINDVTSTERLNVLDNDGTIIHVIEDNNHSSHAQDGFHLVTNTTAAGEWRIDASFPENLVTVAKSGAEFTTIKAAIDSITTASSSNRFEILIHPGTYTEVPLTAPAFVTVQGVDDKLVIVVATAATDTIFTMGNNSSLRHLTIQGASGVGGIGMLIQNVSEVDVSDCEFNDCETCILTQATAGGVNTINNTVTRCVFDPPFDFAIHMDARLVTNPSGFVVAATIQAVTVSSDATCVNAFRFEGPTASALLANLRAVGPSTPAGIGMLLSDGVDVPINMALLYRYVTAFSVDTTGAGPIMQIHGLDCANNTTDVSILHTGATGVIAGTFDKDKVFIDDAIDMAVSFDDPVNKGFAVARNFLLGPRASDMVDTADLIQQAPMGRVTGGTISINGALTIDIAAGFGYVMKNPFNPNPPGHLLRKWEWVAQVAFAVDASTTNYIFWDENEVLSKSSAETHITKNLLLGIVYTDATSILWIDKRNVDAHHYANKADRYVRKVFGPLFAGAGSVTTNPSSDYIAVTAGTFYHNQTQFATSGMDSSALEHTDTLQAGSTTATAVLKAAASSTNDFYIKYFIRITAGPASGDIRRIIGYVGSTKTATVTPVFSGTPGTDTYEIISGFTTVNQNGVNFDYNFGVRLVDVLNFSDGSGGFTALSGTQHAKHSLYLIGNGGLEKYFLVFGQQLFANLAAAVGGVLPTPPSTFTAESMVTVAAIIVDGIGGTSSIVQIDDIRPIPISSAAATAGVTDHGGLTGLGDDDHAQYFLTSGARAMTGALNMGGLNIISVGTVDGVDVSAHTARHGANVGADALATAAPITSLSASTTNTVGTANTFARSDHGHDLDMTSIAGGLDHGLLTGLADDDHTQYLLVSGTRAMSGNLNMGTNNIDNIGILLLEETGAGTDTISIQAPASIAASYTLTLPVDDGAVSQFLQTNGSGVTSWVTLDHGNLAGLADDDHTQYLLVSGTRAMSGDLDMGDNDITDIKTLAINGTSSGTITITGAAAAGTYTLTLPTDDGTNGQHLQTNGSGVTSWITINHDALTGLADDDHLQYLLVSGTRAMSGNLDMGDNNINTISSLLLDGSGSGTVTLTVAAAAGTYTLTLPVNDGTASGQVLSTNGSGVTSWIDHGGLAGLADDDHTQYLLINGSRAMGGNFNMGDNNITDIGLLELDGATSGTVTIAVAAAAGTYTLTLPTDNGNANEFLQTNGSGVTTWADPDHGALGGLTDDDHTQYLLVSGTRAMTGNLNMGCNNITDINNIQFDETGVGTDTITLVAPASIAASYVITLPVDDGAVSQFLQTNGSGVTSWVTPDHGSLGGLADDDHTQYLLVSGTRAMAGTLNMATNNIDNVGIILFEETGVGTDTISIVAPASIAASYTLTLPVDDGAVSQFLQTNGSGVTSWVTPDHGGLGGLADDDHTQYLLVSGTRAMSGDLNMGDNDITNIKTLEIDGTSSGTITITGAAAAGTYTLTLPTNDGDASQFLQTSGAGVTSWVTPDHGGLGGLADDDHTQYLLVSGTRAMSGNLNMATNNIDNIGILLLEETGVGTDTISIVAPASIAASYTITLPVDNGAVSQFLQTNGSGVTSWVTPDHGGLDGLADDDHTQYLLVSGTRAMSGTLNMGANNIDNIGTLLLEETGAGTDTVSIVAPASITASYTITLPVDDGAVSQFLQTNGSGVTSWVTPDHGGLDGLADDDHTQYLLVSGTRAMSGDLNLGDNDITNIKTLEIDGTSSGTITITGAAAAGTYTLTLPVNDGDASQFLQTNGVGVTTWATPDHGGLDGLADDDHTQYLLVSGTRAMSGDLNLGDNDITNIKTLEIDGTSSGTITITGAAAAGTYTLTLPIDNGDANEFLQTNGGGVTSWVTPDHGSLDGLADDDHTQYLLVSGTRAMTGTLDMGGFSLDNVDEVLFEESGGGTDTITLQAPASIGASYTLTLPIDDGTANQVMETDGGGVLSWVTPSASVIDDIYKEFESNDFLNPTNADWALTTDITAPAVDDPTNAGLTVRAFDDTAEEGIGFVMKLPTAKTQFVFRFTWRAATGASSAVIPKLYYRRITNGTPAAPAAWANYVMATISTSADNFFRQSSDTVLFTDPTTNIVANEVYQFEITRDSTNGSDTLSGDWLLLSLVVEVS